MMTASALSACYFFRLPSPGNRRRWVTLLLLLVGALAMAEVKAAPSKADLKHQHAVQLARQGHNDQALRMLRELTEAFPAKADYRYDYITVLGWAEHYREVLAEAPHLRLADAPVYVIESLGRAARGVGETDKAVEYYRLAVRRAPDRADSVLGLAMSLTDQGKPAEAVALLQPLAQRRPADPEVLEALAVAYRNNDEPLAAVAAYDRLLAVQPARREAQRQRILLTARLGSAPLALEMARAHPELFSQDELDTLTIDAASKYIRWSELYEPEPSKRNDDIDRAITLLKDLLQRMEARGAGDTATARRARADLLVAERNRNRPQEAIRLYEALRAQGAEIPDYAAQSAADAYLADQQPNQALAIYQELLARHPGDYQLRMALFYTYLDLNQQERAYAVVDELAAEQTDPDLRLRTDSNAAMARAWSDDLAEAQRRQEALVAAAPNNATLHAGLGSIYLWRGWPRRALEQFRIAQSIEPEVMGGQTGEAEAHRAVNDFAAADAKITGLRDQYPDDTQVERLGRSWDIHNLRELSVRAATTYSTGSRVGSRDLELDTRLYSAPLALHYRVFGHDYFAQSTFPEGRGTYHRYGAGLEYRARDVEASAELSDGFGRDAGLGLSLTGLWLAGDHWRLGARYDSYSNDVPLRGRLNEDIDGWSLAANAEYRVNESRSYAVGAQQLEFSDGNQRTLLSASAFERLINRPRYKLDGRLGLYSSHNARDGASYYNPPSDMSLDASAVNEWLTSRRYGRTFYQRLGVNLGLYDESGYAIKPTGGAYYEHEWRWYDRLGVSYGLGVSRPVYDSVYETHTRLYLNLSWRF